MKSIVSIFAVCLAFAPVVLAQELVKVEVVLGQEQFIPNESMEVGVRITNLSGQTLELGKDKEWLNFSVEGVRSRLVNKMGRVPVQGVFSAENQKRTTKWFDIAPNFDLQESGNYTVTASVLIKEWGLTFVSDPKRFDVVKGNTLWKQEFGVPNSESEGGPPEIRKYVVQQARRKDQLALYVRITDRSENRTFKVFSVGSVVNFGQPEQRLDRVNYLHLLNQSGRQTYNYCAISPAGEIILRRTYQITSRPKLVTEDSGGVVVTGGLLTPSPTDIPSTTEEPPPAESKSSTP